MNKCTSKKWQEILDLSQNNKLHSIKPSLGKWELEPRKCKEQVTVSWLHIGDMRLTHSSILSQPPECSACQTKYTVKHVLIECGDFCPHQTTILPQYKKYERSIWESENRQLYRLSEKKYIYTKKKKGTKPANQKKPQKTSKPTHTCNYMSILQESTYTIW